jgi:hypothetical protein
MDQTAQIMSAEFTDLLAECRQRCLWFLSSDAAPSTRETQLEVLRLIERYGNREDFVNARRLRTWLSRNSSETFSVS